MSSRIADIIVEAKLETRQFMTGLRNMRVNIIANFETLRAFANPVKAIEGAVEDVAGTVIATGQDITRNVEAQTRAADEMVRQIQEQVPTHERVSRAAKKSSDKTTTAFNLMKKEADDMMTQMRWVARDVMRIGITAGIMGALFIRQIKQIGDATMGMLGVFDDMKWILEDIYWIIGEQMAPIFEALVPPMEMIRDFLESHQAIVKVLAVVLILAAAFLMMSGIILGTVGMYAIMLFGMQQFTKAIKQSGEMMQGTGGLFATLTSFLREIGGLGVKAALGIKDFSDKVAWMNQTTKTTPAQVVVFGRTFKALDSVMKTGAFSIKETVRLLEAMKDSGQLTGGAMAGLKKHYIQQYKPMERLRYHFSNVKDSVMGLRGNLGKVGGKLKGVGRGVLGAGKSALTAGAGMAKMLIVMAAIGPIMEAIQPLVEVFTYAVEGLLEIVQPWIDAVVKLLEENPKLVKAILAIAIAVMVLQAAASPLLLVLMAVAAVVLLVAWVVKKLIEVATGKSLDTSLNILTTAFKILFFPVYAIFKLFQIGVGIIKKASGALKGMGDKVRGLGAWLWNLVPQPIKDLAKAILNVLPNPITVLQGLWDIIKGIAMIFSGDWEGGKKKIVEGLKGIIGELIKIPLMIPKIGIAIVKALWNGIKSVIGWLYQKIIGGSLVWDILGWFALLPFELLKIGASMLIKLLEGIQEKVTDLLGEGGLKGLVGQVINFFIGIPIKLLQAGKDMIIYLISGFMGMWTDLFGGEGLGKLVSNIIDFFGGIPIKILQFGKDMIIYFLDGIMGLWDSLFGSESGIGKMGHAIIDFFKNLVNKGFEWGKNLILGFIDGIKDIAHDIGSVLDDYVLSPIKGVLGIESLPKKGPLRNLHTWGEGLVTEFNVGVKKGQNANGIMNALGNMGPPMGQGMGGGTTNITFQNEFTIYATIQDKQDLMTLRDEISSKQLTEARRMRVLGGGI